MKFFFTISFPFALARENWQVEIWDIVSRLCEPRLRKKREQMFEAEKIVSDMVCTFKDKDWWLQGGGGGHSLVSFVLVLYKHYRVYLRFKLKLGKLIEMIIFRSLLTTCELGGIFNAACTVTNTDSSLILNHKFSYCTAKQFRPRPNF